LLILMHFRSVFVICVTLPLAVLFSFLLMWVLRHAGIMSAGFGSLASRAGSVIMMVVFAGFYSVFLFAFSQMAHNWWVVANIGLLLAVRLASAPFDGAQGAGERMARGFAVAALAVVIAVPLMSMKRFPSFGFTPEVFAQLAPGMQASRGLIDNGSDLARAVLLCALFYLLSAALELVRLRTVFPEESAPALGIGDDSRGACAGTN
jgi:hypothetical protein